MLHSDIPRLWRAWSLCLVVALAGCAGAPAAGPTRIDGVIWQPHNSSIAPEGQWDRLGARQLLVQWTAVDGLAFVPEAAMPQVPAIPDWQKIAKAPWAQEVILGLAGRFDEHLARANVQTLASTSIQLARAATPLNVVGWYFPVEIDPTWKDIPGMSDLLRHLPRPLWVSVYDNSNIGATPLANWIETWLPPDVGIFFQDGVGVHTRDASVARQYADVLAKRFGPQRFRLIAEVFRPNLGGGFRSATANELKPQLAMYRGHSVFVFEGPTYLSDALVEEMTGPNPANQ